MSKRVLCVDGEPNILSGFQRNLRKHFALDTAPDGLQTLELIRNHGPYAVVVAAMLSQLGCVTIPAEVVVKWRSGFGLTGQESDLIRRIPELGAGLLSHIPRLEPVSQIVLYQNKHFDGAGFPPDKACGPEIPIGSRILKALGDLGQLEAEGKTRHLALEEMNRREGCYDPKVLRAAYAYFDVCLSDQVSAPAEEVSAPFKEISVSVHDLHPDYILMADVLTKDGTLIVKGGSAVSLTLLERLHDFAALAGVREPILVRAPLLPP